MPVGRKGRVEDDVVEEAGVEADVAREVEELLEGVLEVVEVRGARRFDAEGVFACLTFVSFLFVAVVAGSSAPSSSDSEASSSCSSSVPSSRPFG